MFASLARRGKLPLVEIWSRQRSVSSSCVRLVDNREGEGEDGDQHAKISSRLFQRQQIMNSKEEEAMEAGPPEPPPKVTLDHVTVSFARSGGAGGQNVNKVNTKVDMRFKVMAAKWLPMRARLKLLQTERNKINSDGELIVTSTKNRTQRGNIDDALEKIQEMIDAACYVRPPPSEEMKNRVVKLAAAEDQKRLQLKKQISNKKASRRERF